jgi:hypothetical protein
VNRQQTVLSPSGRETSHIEQMTEIYAGKIAVIGAALGDVVSKAGFLSHLYMKMLILPRQARDKLCQNSQKRFSSGS